MAVQSSNNLALFRRGRRTGDLIFKLAAEGFEIVGEFVEVVVMSRRPC